VALARSAFREHNRVAKGSYQFRRSKTKLPATEAEKRAPLHLKRTGRADLDFWKRNYHRMTSSRRRLVEIAMRVLEDPKVYEELLRGEVFADTTTSCAFSKEDVDKTIEFEVFREIDGVPLGIPLCRAFCVFEEKDMDGFPGEGRRRILLWTKTINDFKAKLAKILDVEPVDLPDLEEVLGMMQVGWALNFDLKSSYHLLKLSEEVQKFFAFKDDSGRCLAHASLPMGFTLSAFCMMQLFSAVVEMAVEKAGELGVEGVRWCIFIDNAFMWHPTKEGSEVLRVAFLDVCKEANLALNDEPEHNVPHQKGVYLGMLYDISSEENRGVQLAEKQINKLKKEKVVAGYSSHSWEQLEAMMGRIYYDTRILHVSPAPFYHCMKEMSDLARKVALGRLSPHEKVKLPSAASEQLHQWIDLLLKNEKVLIKDLCKDPDWYLFSDAGPAGYGGILVNSATGEVHQIGGKWPDFLRAKLKMDGTQKEKASTTELEFRALLICLERWFHLLKGRQVYVFQDNKGVIDVLRKGSSGSFWVNEQAKKAGRLLSELYFSIAYIASEHQVADPQSRQKETDLQKVANVVEFIKEGKWEELLSDKQREAFREPLRADKDCEEKAKQNATKTYLNWLSGRYPCSRSFISPTC
jgi:hypothetical protein